MQHQPESETIKILQLNVWTGRIKGALLEFIKQSSFDLICLQEAVWSPKSDMLEIFASTVEQIKEASDLEYESRTANWTIPAFNSKVHQGNVILSRKKIIEERIELIYGKQEIADSSQKLSDHCYTAQFIKLENNLNVVNYHGYWLPSPIGDNTTTSAMKKVADIAKSMTGPLVMCGDLNVIHKSPAMRELDFLKDLTHEYNVKNTLVGLKFSGQVACDHILINDQIKVLDFKVLDDIVSDHKPLTAEISIK